MFPCEILVTAQSQSLSNSSPLTAPNRSFVNEVTRDVITPTNNYHLVPSLFTHTQQTRYLNVFCYRVETRNSLLYSSTGVCSFLSPLFAPEPGPIPFRHENTFCFELFELSDGETSACPPPPASACCRLESEIEFVLRARFDQLRKIGKVYSSSECFSHPRSRSLFELLRSACSNIARRAGPK